MKPGQDFGRYRIERVLGSGGMGSVFLAHDSRLGRRVALKTVSEGRDAGGKTLERFDREARAAANFRHPNLCKVYDVGEIDGIHYLTMEYIEGRPLLDLLRTGQPLPTIEAATAIVHGAAMGLAEAHRLGVIHRDLKPANIMIDREGVTVVVDFGLARGEVGGDPDLTEVGTFLGTRNYASPEQWSGDPSRIGPASDIYSLGVVLYQMLSGRLPFVGPTPDVLVNQVRTATPDPPSASRPGLDPRLDEICLRTIARDPGDRFRSMTEFAQALSAVQEGLRANGGGRASDSPVAQDGTTVEWNGPKSPQSPPPAPAAVAVARTRAGDVSTTVSERSGGPDGARKPLPVGNTTFARAYPSDPRGLGHYGLVAAIVAGLAALALAACLVYLKAGDAGPSAPREGANSGQGGGRPGPESIAVNPPVGEPPEPPKPPRPSKLTVPGRARIVSTMGDTLDVARKAAYDGAQRAEPVRAGQEVVLVEGSADGGSFKARDTSGKDLGWIPRAYLTTNPSDSTD